MFKKSHFLKKEIFFFEKTKKNVLSGFILRTLYIDDGKSIKTFETIFETIQF
jgi:hypothetical protein